MSMKYITSNQGSVKKKVLYAKAVYGKEEINAVVKSLENGWLASGVLVKEFEKEVAKRFGKKYGIAVNSGSSATLLAVKAIKDHHRTYFNNKVITPACTFSTTVSAIVLNGLLPCFVDVEVGKYVIDVDKVERIFIDTLGKGFKAKKDQHSITAILVPQLIGGVCDMVRLRELADKYETYIIDDSCDTFAPTLHGRTTASYADISCTSFYGSHIITAMGIGGMIMTDREDIRDKVITLRDWGRIGNDQEDFEKRFDFTVDGIPYDQKFLYSEYGYNLKMNEASAAFGLEQLKKLPQFLKIRKENFDLLYYYFQLWQDYFYLPQLISGAETNWLAFPLTIKRSAPFNRYDLLKYLESKGIQTRVLFSGNITRHPKYRVENFYRRDDYPISDLIMERGFLLGCHHGMGKEEVEYIINTIKVFIKSYV